MILNLIILIVGTVFLIKIFVSLSKYLLFGLTLPVYMVYQVFLPEQRESVLKVLKVFILPVFIIFFPFIVARKMRDKHPKYALWSSILWSLTYLVFAIDLLVYFR